MYAGRVLDAAWIGGRVVAAVLEWGLGFQLGAQTVLLLRAMEEPGQGDRRVQVVVVLVGVVLG